jgi:hypothetical protein
VIFIVRRVRSIVNCTPRSFSSSCPFHELGKCVRLHESGKCTLFHESGKCILFHNETGGIHSRLHSPSTSRGSNHIIHYHSRSEKRTDSASPSRVGKVHPCSRVGKVHPFSRVGKVHPFSRVGKVHPLSQRNMTLGPIRIKAIRK